MAPDIGAQRRWSRDSGRGICGARQTNRKHWLGARPSGGRAGAHRTKAAKPLAVTLRIRLIISVHMESDQLPTDRVAMLRMMPMPADANVHGDVFGGWIMSHVDVAGAIPPRAAPAGASRRLPSRHSCSGR